MTDANAILAPYVPWLRKVAAGMTAWDAEDLAQEGYIEMWRALRNFQSDRGVLDHWLKFKAHARMLTVVTRRRQRDDSLPEDWDPAAPDLLGHVSLAYHHGEIARALASLTPAQRKYVYARFWLGLSGREMIELGVFGYDPSALWTSQRNGARLKLKAALAHLAEVLHELTAVRVAEAGTARAAQARRLPLG